MFDEFVIDVSLSVMIKQRDMLTMLKGLEDKLDLIGWINDILWNWANENVGKNWWLVGRWADIESLPNFEDLKEWLHELYDSPDKWGGWQMVAVAFDSWVIERYRKSTDLWR